MPIYDISQPISESLVVWPGDPPVRITRPAHLDRGDLMTLSRLDMSAHTGTHVDAPAHFVAGGLAVDGLALDVLVGPAWVVHTLDAGLITADLLASSAIPPGTERLLLRTRNSDRWMQGKGPFFQDYVGVTQDGAQWLLDRGVRLVGIDYLSVAAYDDTVAVHRLLLHAGVILVEGLSLGGIAPGSYRLVCLPLKLAGVEGAPARAILIDDLT
jgi:arylformamidase